MTQTQYRAFVALAIVSGGVLASADSLTHRSLASSILSAAFTRFHNLREPHVIIPKTIATAVQVVAVAKTQGATPITADVVTKQSSQTPITADVVPMKQDQPVTKPDGAKSKKPSVKKDIAPTVPIVIGQSEPKVVDLKPANTAPPAPKIIATNGTVTNVFVDADIKSVMNEVASLAGVTVIADDTIKEQTISIEFKNEPIDSVVEKLAMMAGAYSKQQSPGVYLISKATTDSTFFSKFAETKIYSVRYQTAASIQALLSLSYKPYLAVDPKTNSIGICAPKPVMEKILADIQKADRPARQIFVEALVTEISVEDALNTSFSGSAGKWSLGSTLGITTQAAGYAEIAQIQSLINNHKMKLRANPHLVATAGQEALVNVGQDTYYSLLSGSTVYPTTQIQLIHTGVTLKFTATIDDDGQITMQLDPTVSDAVVSVNGNPTSNIRTASTRVRVKSGETIVIAGLVQETGDRQVLRLPILGYLPIIGEAFTQRSYDKKKVETVFLITPKIMDSK